MIQQLDENLFSLILLFSQTNGIRWCPGLKFVSVLPRRSLRLGGGKVNRALHRRDAEDAENTQRVKPGHYPQSFLIATTSLFDT